jgi:uncharacterized BrkB/YihY/UPF0761 family membrane protein
VGALFWLVRLIEKSLITLMPSFHETIQTVFDPIEIGVPLIAALTLIYRWVPARINLWRAPLASAALVTVLIEIARYLIAHYFAQLQQLKSLYGAFIAFPVLMVTTFVIWALVLYGGALVAEGFGSTWRRRSGKAPARSTKPRTT